MWVNSELNIYDSTFWDKQLSMLSLDDFTWSSQVCEFVRANSFYLFKKATTMFWWEHLIYIKTLAMWQWHFPVKHVQSSWNPRHNWCHIECNGTSRRFMSNHIIARGAWVVSHTLSFLCSIVHHIYAWLSTSLYTNSLVKL